MSHGFILQTLKQKTHEKNDYPLVCNGPHGMHTLCAQRTASVSLDPETRFQKIDGFGGCGMNGQWADVYTRTSGLVVGTGRNGL